ncbi:hypothetical protein U875_25595 [Pandoraea pnomenusa 3kgm]|nr:hypothetical protein U875_25595 [Pandoraea pnomenusa 3kgm]
MPCRGPGRKRTSDGALGARDRRRAPMSTVRERQVDSGAGCLRARQSREFRASGATSPLAGEPMMPAMHDVGNAADGARQRGGLVAWWRWGSRG